MNKNIRVIIVVTFVVLLTFIIYVTEESLRISHNCLAKPLFVIETIEKEDSVIYESLGFKVVVKDWQLDNETICLGQEFWLFNKFMLWGWIS